MPVRKLFEFLAEQGLIQRCSLKELEHTRLGVEGGWWVRRMSPEEPKYPAMSGEPMTMLAPLKHELQSFAQHNIKPLVVFDGFFTKDRRDDSRAGKLNMAWELHYKGRGAEADALFKQTDRFISQQFIPNVMKYLNESGVDNLRAPYTSWAQLGHFSSTGLVNAVLGDLELLIFGVSRVVVNIDFEKDMVEWVDYNAILHRFALTPDQFLDTCLLAGFTLCTTYPGLLQDSVFSFKRAIDMVREHRSGHAAILYQQSLQQRRSYMDTFLRARALVKHHIIMLPNGVCEPLHKETCPSDIHNVISNRLPNELYFLISQGVISPQVVISLISGTIQDQAPFVDSVEYRQLILELTELRAKTIGLISTAMNQMFKTKIVSASKWFDNFSSETSLSHWSTLPRSILQRGARVTQKMISTELEKQKQAAVSLPLVMLMQGIVSSTPSTSELSSSAGADYPMIATPDELLFNIYYQALVMKEYLLTDNTVTVIGKVLEGVKPRFQEECMLVLELTKLAHITGNRMTTFGTPPSMAVEALPKGVILLTRVLSVLGMKFVPGAKWTGPVDWDIQAFHELTQGVHRSLRNLFEMALAGLVLRRRTALEPHEYGLVGSRLPFFQLPNTAMALVLKAFLVEGLTPAQLQKRFPECADIAGDLHNAYELWAEVMRMMTFLKDYDSIQPELLAVIENANSLMAAKRSLLGK